MYMATCIEEIVASETWTEQLTTIVYNQWTKYTDFLVINQ